MNKNNRTYLLITRSLDRLEATVASSASLPPADAEQAAMDAVGLLDELRRLRRKWDEQAAEGDPRRSPSDFRTHDQWLARWRLVAGKLMRAAGEQSPAGAALGRAVELSKTPS
ncbi:MAG TPA: hypothetical protein VF796_22735 [Humisphaera sp.]